MIRVAVADDHDLVRAGFRIILEAEADLTVVGEAADGEAAIALARSERPDIVLMDVQMPGIGGLDATAAIVDSFPETRVLILTPFERDDYIFGAIRNGAAGVSPEELASGGAGGGGSNRRRRRRLAGPVRDPAYRRGVRAPCPGYPPSRPPATDGSGDRGSRVGGPGSDQFRDRRCAVRGRRHRQSHVSAILTKLSLRDRVQAVVFAYEAGVIRPGS
ncbi:response regulator transcription factor [soil metagenome]